MGPRISLLILFLLLGHLPGVVGMSQARVWLTAIDAQGNPTILLEEQPSDFLSSGRRMSETDLHIHINTSHKLQQMVGFGAGLPQASAKVLSSLKTANPFLYKQVMNRLFSPGLSPSKNKSIGISAVRFPIGSCDFSMSEHTYDDVQGDFGLKNFKVDNDSMLIVKVLQDAILINPDLVLVAAPWSPPAWLKVGGTMDGKANSNTLRPDSKVFQTYALYFKNVVDTFAGFGLPLDYISLQNEPLFGHGNYPGMYLDPKDAAKLGMLVKSAVGDSVKLMAYDHNWDRPDYPKSVLDAAPDAFAGTAWHCYAGKNDAQDEVHAAHPEKETHVTECTGSYPNHKCDIEKGMSGFGGNHEWDMEHILLGATTHWASSGIKWIMALDQNCGPTLPQVTYHNGRPFVSVPDGAQTISDIKFNQDYWSVGHMSKFVRKGSFRVQSNKTDFTSPEDRDSNYIAEAFSDGNGTTTLIVLNQNHQTSLRVGVDVNSVKFTPDGSDDGNAYSFTVPAWGTAVVILPRI